MNDTTARLFVDGQPSGSITPTYLTLVETERMVRRACGMSRGVPLATLADMLERVANDFRVISNWALDVYVATDPKDVE